MQRWSRSPLIGRQEVREFREIGKRWQIGCFEAEGWNNSARWHEGMDTLPSRQPALCIGPPSAPVVFHERDSQVRVLGWERVIFALCDSGESEQLQRGRHKAEQGNEKKKAAWEGRGELWSYSMSQPWLKKEAVATSTGDQQGKIRQVVKQHSSAWPFCPLETEQWPRTLGRQSNKPHFRFDLVYHLWLTTNWVNSAYYSTSGGL